MTNSVYDTSVDELLRLNLAFAALKSPEIRAEFLRNVESWAADQWDAGS